MVVASVSAVSVASCVEFVDTGVAVTALVVVLNSDSVEVVVSTDVVEGFSDGNMLVVAVV